MPRARAPDRLPTGGWVNRREETTVIRRRCAFAGCAVAVLAVAVGAVNAPAASAAPTASESIAADGYFNAYYDLNLQSICHRWKGNEPDWSYYGCANEVQSV